MDKDRRLIRILHQLQKRKNLLIRRPHTRKNRQMDRSHAERFNDLLLLASDMFGAQIDDRPNPHLCQLPKSFRRRLSAAVKVLIDAGKMGKGL